MSAATRPSPGPPRPFRLPPVASARLRGGLELRTVHLPRLPLVSVVLVIDAGEGSVDAARGGLALLTSAALEGGTHRRTGEAIAEDFERLGTSLSASSGWDSTSLSLSVLPERLETALALLAENLLEPSFPPAEVERLREQRLAAIQQREADPSSLATDRFARELYDRAAPYARPLGGSRTSVEALGRGALVGFATDQYRPERGGLAIGGAVDPERAREAAEGALGGWSGAPLSSSAAEATPSMASPRILVVDRPGSVQSQIRVGHPGVPRSTLDYFPLRVFNGVLGGTFTSRLNLNLRERNGFTYGVRSHFRMRRGAGPFLVSTGVGTEVTAAAVGEIFAEIERLVSDGPGAEEVRTVQDYLIGVFPLMMETGGQLARRLTHLFIYDLPEDYFESWRERMEAVTPERAWEVGRRHLRPAELRTVVVGDAEAVVPALEGLARGPVEVVPAEEEEELPGAGT